MVLARNHGLATYHIWEARSKISCLLLDRSRIPRGMCTNPQPNLTLPSDGCKRWGGVTSFWRNLGLKLCYRITTLLLLLRHKGANLFLTCYSIIKQHAELWTTLSQKCLRDPHAFSPCVIGRMYFIVTCLRIINNEHSLLILFVSHKKRKQ